MLKLLKKRIKLEKKEKKTLRIKNNQILIRFDSLNLKNNFFFLNFKILIILSPVFIIQIYEKK